MSDCDLETSVPDWLIEHPETWAVFRELGIDDACGGKSLEYACCQRGLNPESVIATLRSHIERHAKGERGTAKPTKHDFKEK